MRSLRSFEVEPWLRSAGQQVWTRLRRGLGSREEELQTALQQEVEALRSVQGQVQRATQLARVLDAVYALADAHELSEAQLSALRDVRPAPRVAPVVELARSAVQALEQVLKGEPARAPGTQLSVRADGPGLEAFTGWRWLAPLSAAAQRGLPHRAADARVVEPGGRSAAGASTPARSASGRTSDGPRGARAAVPGQSVRASALKAPPGDLPAGNRVRLTLPGAALAMRVTDLTTELRLSLPAAALDRLSSLAAELPLPPTAAALAARVSGLAAELSGAPASGAPGGDLAADVLLERAGVDAARAQLSFSPSELSLRLRITHQAVRDALQWWSERSRAEITLWLLSRGTQLVVRKLVVPQLARTELGPQLLLQAALASGDAAGVPLRRLSAPVSRAAARVRRVRRAVSPRRLLGS